MTTTSLLVSEAIAAEIFSRPCDLSFYIGRARGKFTLTVSRGPELNKGKLLFASDAEHVDFESAVNQARDLLEGILDFSIRNPDLGSIAVDETAPTTMGEVFGGSSPEAKFNTTFIDRVIKFLTEQGAVSTYDW